MNSRFWKDLHHFVPSMECTFHKDGQTWLVFGPELDSQWSAKLIENLPMTGEGVTFPRPGQYVVKDSEEKLFAILDHPDAIEIWGIDAIDLLDAGQPPFTYCPVTSEDYEECFRIATSIGRLDLVQNPKEQQ